MTKYKNIKKELSEMFENLLIRMPYSVQDIESETFIIYLGYRISKSKDDSGYVEIVNARSSNFYKPLPITDFDKCIEEGFEKFCDKKQIERDYLRIESLTDKIQKAISNSQPTKDLVEERRFITKRIQRLLSKKY